MKKITLFLLLSLLTTLYSEEQLFIIPINGTIEPAIAAFVKKGIDEATGSDGPILFEINTFGGRVDTALQITTLIGSIKDRETIAYIPSNPEGTGVSWSAGAIISFSCNTIYMAEGTSLGAATPVYITPEGTQSAGEKSISAVRVHMQSLAEKNGFPPDVAIAMVDEDVELYESVIDGKVELLTVDKIPEDTPKKLFLPKGKLLTLSARQMEYYGISEKTVNSLDEILVERGIEQENVFRIEKNIPDQLISLLTSSTVLALLMTLGLVCIYMELTSPGFGVLGSIGIIAFATVFIGGELMGTLDSLEILLFIIGIALLVVEIFLIPGFGLTGVSGLICIGAALVLSMQNFVLPKWQWQWDIFNRNLMSVFAGFVLSVIIISLIMTLFPKVSLFKRLILDAPPPANDIDTALPVIGYSVTKLRPVGKIKIGDQIIEAAGEGGFIEKGKKIEVISHIGNRVIVKEVSDETDL